MDDTSLSVFKAEIMYQCEAIAAVIAKIQERRLEYQQSAVRTESLAYQLHNLYCAFEDLFKIVAKFFENMVEDSSRYHIELLHRMALDIEGVRPSLLSRELCAALDELRAFRHVFRHAYSYDLDPKKIGLLLDQFDIIQDQYQEDVQRFLMLLDEAVAQR